jgi:CheY-like chemotaxis protein
MKTEKQVTPVQILLADDDPDDRAFFAAALTEIANPTRLSTVQNGEELMDLLANENLKLPDVLFLDLNMPRKNGFECLIEIDANEKLKDLSVIIFSTSYPQNKNYELNLINTLFRMGAQVYIRKPNDFNQLKQLIRHTLAMTSEKMDSGCEIKYILNA